MYYEREECTHDLIILLFLLNISVPAFVKQFYEVDVA